MRGRAIAVGLLLPLVVGLVGALLAMRLSPSARTQMGPFTVSITSGFGAGETVVGLPPLGEMRLDTHDSPLKVRAELTDIDLDDLTEDLRTKSTDAIVDQVESEARRGIRPFALRILSVATLGGVLGGAVVFRQRWRRVIASGVVALLAVGGAEAVAWRTFDPDAFAEPTFEGTLELAPQLLGPVGEISETIDAFRTNVERIVRGAIRAYSALEPQTIGGRDEVRLLHISDIHLNTLGIDFAVGLAKGFDVDLVLDTGDLTSYGTNLEESIASQIPRFGRPYLFVRGNHDPPSLIERLEATGDARVLEDAMVTESGLRIYGQPHPVFTEDGQNDVDDADIGEGARDAASRLSAAVGGLEDVPHIVAVHDDRMAEELSGAVPLVLSGHFHDARATTVDGTVYLRAGSTGGAGVNMFQHGTPIPLSATVLYFDRGDDMTLTAYDVVEQSPTTGLLTIQRKLVTDVVAEDRNPDESPVVTTSEEAIR